MTSGVEGGSGSADVLGDSTKVIMLHMNYPSRAAAHGDFPKHPTYYLKPPSTLTTSGAAVVRPPGCQFLISEGEVALVVGRRVKGVGRDEAWSAISHIAAANDFTVLDFLGSDPSLTRWKGWDGFTPIGNLVDAQTVDPTNLELRVRVNGEQRQQDNTSTLLFPFVDLVSDLSGVMTLMPGDVILTGTPAGAGPVAPGDEVTVEIVGHSSVTALIDNATGPLSPLSPEPVPTPEARAHALGVVAPRPVILAGSEWRALRDRPVTETLALAVAAGLKPLQLPLRLTGADGPRVGHALTVRQIPSRVGGQDAATTQLGAALAAGPDEVVIVEVQGRLDAAALPGDALDRIAANDAAAVLTDGALNAVEGLPTASAAQAPPVPWESGHRPAGVNVPVVLHGQAIEPGDLVVIDADECLIFPAALQPGLATALPDNAGEHRGRLDDHRRPTAV